MRIYELAKELDINSKELMDIIKKEFGIELKTHMSSVSDLETLRIKKYFSEKNNEKKATQSEVSESEKDKVVSKKTKVKSKESMTENKTNNKTNDKINNKTNNNTNSKTNNKTNNNTNSKTNNKTNNNTNSKTNNKTNSNTNKTNNKTNNKGKQVHTNRNLEKHTKNKKHRKNKTNDDKTNISDIIEFGENIIVRDFAKAINQPISTIISKLIILGIMASMNQEIDFETASIVADEFGISIKKKEVIDELKIIEEELEDEVADLEEELVERPPIVTVMGHVDHGKTSLLDAMRNTDVIDHEAGGITQHIGASIVVSEGKKIVFLDTPGHEAFTAMRARGAQVTDIAILVVAADDGIMPQTVEAINHAKAANVPIIVAINKIDKPGCNIDRVKQELSENGLVPEDWGGETICVPVSAKMKTGIKDLLEMILLVAEVQEFKANPNRVAKGIIIEANLDKGRGPVATVLIEKGTLHKGDAVLAGSSYAKIRAMVDSKGKRINSAGPSIPVEIVGLSQVPEAGEHMYVMSSEKEARAIAEKRKDKIREKSINNVSRVSLDDLFEKIQKGEVKDLNIIIKADVSGSIGAIKQSLEKLSIDEVKVKTIHDGVGGINETDIMLASASNAIVIGFNVRPTSSALELAKRELVDIRTYRVIYNAIEDIEAAVKGMLEPEFVEVVQGRAEVRAIFKVPNIGNIAGVYILNGKVTRKSKIRLLRNNIVIHEGDISSLKRFKDDVSELNNGYEGGIGIEKYNDIKEGDILEAFTMKEVNK